MGFNSSFKGLKITLKFTAHVWGFDSDTNSKTFQRETRFLDANFKI